METAQPDFDASGRKSAITKAPDLVSLLGIQVFLTRKGKTEEEEEEEWE